jgi:hypothetical protein
MDGIDFLRALVEAFNARMEIKNQDKTPQQLINEFAAILKAEGHDTDFYPQKVNKVIIDVTGGLVQSVTHNIPDLDVCVIDYDVDGADETQQIDGNEAYVYIGEPGHFDPDRVENIHNQINEQS